MKKVVLLGDSIRQIGYGQSVAAMLKEKYGEDICVWQPDDNCRFCYYTLRGVLCDWYENVQDCDVIHWNNGLWDTCYPEFEGPFTPMSVYCDCMVRIAKILKQRSKKIIFATTTPVKEDKLDQDCSIIERYNKAVVPLLEAEGIIINDLNSLISKDIPNLICEDNIHLSETGIELAAKQVFGAIDKLL